MRGVGLQWYTLKDYENYKRERRESFVISLTVWTGFVERVPQCTIARAGMVELRAPEYEVALGWDFGKDTCVCICMKPALLLLNTVGTVAIM